LHRDQHHPHVRPRQHDQRDAERKRDDHDHVARQQHEHDGHGRERLDELQLVDDGDDPERHCAEQHRFEHEPLTL
jgi:hypothetical protein